MIKKLMLILRPTYYSCSSSQSRPSLWVGCKETSVIGISSIHSPRSSPCLLEHPTTISKTVISRIFMTPITAPSAHLQSEYSLFFKHRLCILHSYFHWAVLQAMHQLNQKVCSSAERFKLSCPAGCLRLRVERIRHSTSSDSIQV